MDAEYLGSGVTFVLPLSLPLYLNKMVQIPTSGPDA